MDIYKNSASLLRRFFFLNTIFHCIMCKRIENVIKEVYELEQGNEIELNKYVITISVRQLVEFILRCGDIDNRHSRSVENAMQEGSRIHRMIQSRMGDEYTAEVALKYQYETERYVVKIEGRADGVICEKNLNRPENLLMDGQLTLSEEVIGESYDQVTIDEIKSVARSLDLVKNPVMVHLAQAKVYAFIYAKQHSLPVIRVRMTYCNMETEELKYFIEEYFFEELELWFDELMENYRRWADFQFDWYDKRQSSIKELKFPFPYREGQRELAVSVYQTLKEKKKLFLEAPTGVGKTISTVFPAVKSIGEGLTQKIFYLTAKTITRTVADETFELLRKQAMALKTVVITAKEKICPLEKADCNPQACAYAKGHYDRVNDAMYAALTQNDRIDRSVIEDISRQYQVCPFELCLDISLFADAIICDYNYVFDPHASLKRYFAEGSHGDYVFLIDEAHNLVDRGRSMYSASLLKEEFLHLKQQLKEIMKDQVLSKHIKNSHLITKIVSALDRCNKELLALKRECESCLLLETIDPFAGLLESLYTAMSKFLDEDEEPQIRQDVLDFYFEISHFLMIYEKMDEHYQIYCELQEDGSFLLKLFCVNPGKNLSECMARGRSSILFSATLLPIQYYKNLLGGENTDYETYAKSAFDNKKLGLFIGKDVTSKYTRRNEKEYEKIAQYLADVVKVKQGNYMMFFPSHAFLANVYEAFLEHYYDESTMECILQEEFMTEETREAFLLRFSERNLSRPVTKKDAGKAIRSLIGFCVLGGIFSEGIDLKEDALIGCMIVGTGLPMVCNEREILKEFFDDASNSGFDYAYRFPGMNKVLQAAGRVIRTVEDIGIVVLMDERFLDRSYQRLFPREWKQYQITNGNGMGNAIEAFWEEHKTT